MLTPNVESGPLPCCLHFISFPSGPLSSSLQLPRISFVIFYALFVIPSTASHLLHHLLCPFRHPFWSDLFLHLVINKKTSNPTSPFQPFRKSCLRDCEHAVSPHIFTTIFICFFFPASVNIAARRSSPRRPEAHTFASFMLCISSSRVCLFLSSSPL